MGGAYCLRCKKKTDILNPQVEKTINNRIRVKGDCSFCQKPVSVFVSNAEARGGAISQQQDNNNNFLEGLAELAGEVLPELLI
jgi:hypothetical protein